MSQNAHCADASLKNRQIHKNPLEKYPIAQIPRHKKTPIRQWAYSGCFLLAGEDEISSVSMSDYLI
jgi:hypothetical protein